MRIKNSKIKLVVYLRLFAFVFLSITTLYSCKSSFPATGTSIECNGRFLVPVLNPMQRPEFNGGRQAMHRYFKANLTAPQEVINSGKNVNGKIRVAFVITKEGKVCDVRITSKPKKYLDDEVIRVIKIMPKWIPGINEGKVVDSYVLLDFKL
jgi:TonB family protein